MAIFMWKKRFSIPRPNKTTHLFCTLHFPSRSCPTKEDPDPFHATLTEEHQEARMKRKRKPPKDYRSDRIKFRKLYQISSSSETDENIIEIVHSPLIRRPSHERRRVADRTRKLASESQTKYQKISLDFTLVSLNLCTNF